jgi:hypothetical protein
MRYAIAMVMVLGMAIASMVPAAHAGDKTDPTVYRNGHVVLQTAPPVYLATGSDTATVAGPAHPNLSGPYQQEHYDNWGH